MIVNHFSALAGAKRMKISAIRAATGLSRTTLTALYHDRAKGIQFDTLDKLCQCLQCQPGDLFTLDPQQHDSSEH